MREQAGEINGSLGDQSETSDDFPYSIIIINFINPSSIPFG